MPDITFNNGSTVTIPSDRIYATSRSGERIVSWDTTPQTLSLNISDEGNARFRENLLRSASMELSHSYTTDELSQAANRVSESMRDSSFCYSTSSNHQNNTNSIHSYNYIPDRFNFNKLSDEDELYMGVEIEVDCGGEDNNIAKQAMDIVNGDNEIIYCKHDGSLTNGFEIVSHPCTYEFYKTIRYEKLFKYLVSKGYKSHDVSTCGLHVHINRNYFGDNKLTQDLCISKLLYILEKFWDKVEIVARRKSNGYARRFYLNDDESPLDLYVKSKDATKYGAVNLQHKNTIEIRIFKGTLKYDTFMNTLEFVKKIAKLVKDTDIYDIQYVTWDKITTMFSDELNQYIIDREEQQNKEDKDRLNEQIERDRVISSNLHIDRMSDLGTSFASLTAAWGSINTQPMENELRRLRNSNRNVTEIT